jgi:hypothetical protein
VRDGAMIDVSGAVGVKVAMEANNIKINVQGEQRDAPVNRDGGKLINNDVWVDCASWCSCRQAPTATPRIAGTPPVACWKWAATSAPKGTR